MTFILVARNPAINREVHWRGGVEWSYQPNDAARFMTKKDAVGTLEILASFPDTEAWMRDAKAEPWPTEDIVPEPDAPD